MQHTPATPGAPRPQPPASFLLAFLRSEALGGYVLMAAALAALVVANSGVAPAYFDLLGTKVGFEAGPVVLKETVLHWINDGLMAVFFLLVGLEIKREMLDGQLRGAGRIEVMDMVTGAHPITPDRSPTALPADRISVPGVRYVGSTASQ